MVFDFVATTSYLDRMYCISRLDMMYVFVHVARSQVDDALQDDV